MDLKVSLERLEALIVNVLRTKYDEESARLMAAPILFAECSGRPSHGLIRLMRGRFGPMDDRATAPVEVQSRTPVSSTVEGHGNPGMLVAAIAMRESIRLAQTHGIALVTGRGHRSTTGACGYYADAIAREDLVGIVLTNTAPCVTTHDGRDRLFGTNPLAFGVPGDDRPVVMDMAASATTVGDVMLAKAAGRPLAEATVVDARGAPTTDPALMSAILPFAPSHKATVIALLVELLAGALTGATFTGQRSNLGWGVFILVFSPALVGDVQELKSNVTLLARTLANSPARDGGHVRVPGARSEAARQEARRTGEVEVDDRLLATIEQLAARSSAEPRG